MVYHRCSPPNIRGAKRPTTPRGPKLLRRCQPGVWRSLGNLAGLTRRGGKHRRAFRNSNRWRRRRCGSRARLELRCGSSRGILRRMRVAIPGHYASVLGGIGTYAAMLTEAVGASAPNGGSVIAPPPRPPAGVGPIAPAEGGLPPNAWEQVALP